MVCLYGGSLQRVFQRIHIGGYYRSYYQRQDKRVVNDKSYGGRLTEGNKMMAVIFLSLTTLVKGLLCLEGVF